MEVLKQTKQSNLKQKLIETLEKIPEENFVEPIEINREIIQRELQNQMLKLNIAIYLQNPIVFKTGGNNGES